MNRTEAAAWLRAHDNFIIITHVRPDGDTLGSAGALALCLRRMGKTAYLLPNPQTTPRYMARMTGLFAPEGYAWDTVLSVDTATEGLFPDTAAPLLGKTELCIDHHPSNTGYAANLLLDETAAACGELMYALILELTGSVTEREAELLYIAVSTDTGCFAFGNTTAESFRIAGLCAAAGAPIGEINKEFFRTKSRRRLALEGRIMADMRFYRDGGIAVSRVLLRDVTELSADDDDLDAVAAIPGSIEGVIAGVTLREQPGGKVKVSLRTQPQIDSCAVCKKFGGGGHAMAAGCTIEADIDTAMERIVAALNEDWTA